MVVQSQFNTIKRWETQYIEKSKGSILITGGTGLIGRRLAKRLLDEGYSVRCMVRHASAGCGGQSLSAT
ncbi:MAG: NAD-dependent epimerase/dehydratase family protein [Deltaproteobacteria bacterium]